MILTSGASAAALVALAVLAVSVAAGRPDVAVVAAPVLLATLWAAAVRPDRAATVSVRLADGHGPGTRVHAQAQVSAPVGTESVRLRVAAHGYQECSALLAVHPEPRTLALSLTSARTGVRRLFRIDHLSHSREGLLVSEPGRAGPVRVVVQPMARPLRRLPMPLRMSGLTGSHTSRRVGDGVELHDVAELVPGDRLRRIDWRVSARRGLDVTSGRLGTLYVRRTFATADATVVLVVDSRDEVGPDVATWSGAGDVRVDEPTSLDLAREAVASLAQAYLEGGDRVGLDDLGRRARPVRPGTGRNHWQRISQRLMRLTPEGWPERRVRAPQLPSGALVVLCSTFLDEEAARTAGAWRSQGHRVIAVDTLPPVRTTGLTPYQDTAFRMVRLERALRLRELTRTGVELVRWADDPELELHTLARTRHGRR